MERNELLKEQKMDLPQLLKKLKEKYNNMREKTKESEQSILTHVPTFKEHEWAIFKNEEMSLESKDETRILDYLSQIKGETLNDLYKLQKEMMSSLVLSGDRLSKEKD